jgi:hypothetical protein
MLEPVVLFGDGRAAQIESSFRLSTSQARPAPSWIDLAVGGSTPVRVVHVVELRDALEEVYLAAGRAAPPYTRTTISVGQTVIAAVDITELRAVVLAIW